jgi:tetratricopeptide (TPR) repeat protein
MENPLSSAAMGRRAPTHVDDAAAVGRRLRAARTAKGLSLRDLSFEACSPSFLSRIESGRRVASLPILLELAKRLDVAVEDLTGMQPAVRPAELVDLELAVRMDAEDAEARAEAVLARARELGDDEAAAAALEAMGHLAMARRDDEAAVDAFEQARATGRLEPRRRPALYQALGRAYAGLGDLARAIAVLTAAVEDAEREPADASLLVRFGSTLANVYTDGGRFADAEQLLARILAQDAPVDPLSRIRTEWALARTYADQGRTEVAERYSRRLLQRLEETEEHETLGRAHLLLATILLDRAAVDEAGEHLRRAEHLMANAAPPELALVTVEQARAALLRDDHELARRLARQALAQTEATEPSIAGTALGVLAEVEFAAGDLEEARALCHEALERLESTLSPHWTARVLDLLSSVEEQAGNLQAALAAARRATEAHRASHA